MNQVFELLPSVFGELVDFWSELALPDRIAPHILDDNPDNYTNISQADMDKVLAYIAVGDRGAAYLLLAEKTGNKGLSDIEFEGLARYESTATPKSARWGLLKWLGGACRAQ